MNMEVFNKKQIAVTYLFQDGLYNEQWNPDTSPRNGVTLHIDGAGIHWETEKQE